MDGLFKKGALDGQSGYGKNVGEMRDQSSNYFLLVLETDLLILSPLIHYWSRLTVKSRFYESQFYELSQFYEVRPNDQFFTS